MSAGPSIVVQQRVQWADTDASGHIYYGAVNRLLDVAESALLDQLGVRERLYGHTPRVRVAFNFRRVLRFYDPVEVEVSIGAVGRTSFTLLLWVRHEGEVAIDGETVAVLVDDRGKPTTWPEDIRARLLH